MIDIDRINRILEIQQLEQDEWSEWIEDRDELIAELIIWLTEVR